jgi:hypothetical protein
LDESISLHSRRLILLFSANPISFFEKGEGKAKIFREAKTHFERGIFLPLQKGGFPPLKKGGFSLKSLTAGALSLSTLPFP